MRSFHLKDLISVQTLNAPEGTVEVFDSMYESKTILTKEEIMTQFKVDETSKESTGSGHFYELFLQKVLLV